MNKVAIVEDDPVIRQMYRMKFESEGFNVQLASNGKDGVEMVKSFEPDLLLLDLQMPHMNGDEALERIRKQKTGKDLPVIILTNLGYEEAPQKLKSLGALHYIVKAELTPRQVVSRAKEVLGL